MSEVALRNDREVEVHANGNGHKPSALMSWAQEAREVALIAESIAKTSFVPKVFAGKPAEVTAAILAGAELGMGPMASLRAINIIQGTPALSALAMRAQVQGQGHELRVLESTETRAIVEGRRRGESEWQRSTWTIERAKKLNLTAKDNWRQQPQAMLIARATAECSRWVAADALLGMPYAAEEVADEVLEPIAATAEVTKPAPRKTAQRAALPPPTPAPEPDLEDDEQEPMTDKQSRMMFALLGKNGLADKEPALAYICETIGRTITSRAELTKREAGAVIDALEAVPVDEPPLDGDWPDGPEVKP